MDLSSRQILCAAVGKGGEHDFKLFKRGKIRIQPAIECLGDRGYQGLQKLHPNSRTPKKKARGRVLSSAERQQNRALSSQRIVCEHVIGKLKVFKILAERYRNRRRRFGLRVHLLAAIYNLELRRPL